MLAVCMGADNESVFAFEKSGSEIVTDLVGFLRRYLTGLKGLPHLIGDHAVRFVPPGQQAVLPLCQKKLLVCRPMVAAIGRDEFAAVGLVRVFGIVRSICKALRDGFPFRTDCAR